ncbi:uncharacterized protein UBRO2_03324 [Ustilago bromivora]|uniref:Inner centromere protein ARK-binding domain-containing protein n=2 Tax=Ustilago bromivora TaxID=307758 RepID=A0A8H8QNK4_9BASI|nr:uncharacterized protein UBRO2_03324 [Ustilago bromivora]
MPGVRAASRRVPALEPSLNGPASSSSNSSASPSTPEANLLGHVNNMRKCCDMSLFYKNLQEQGVDFIADSLLHANDIFAKYATTSRTVASPSKLAGELLKSPTRTRTRGATGRSRAALNTSSDPFIDAADVFDKENAPIPARSSRLRTASTIEPQKGKGKAKAKTIEVVNEAPESPAPRPARKVLGDLNAGKAFQKQNAQSTKTAATKKGARKDIAIEDDSMPIDASIHEDASPIEAIPRASTPPLNASPPKSTSTQGTKEFTKKKTADATSIIDSEEEVSEDDGDSDAGASAANAQQGGSQTQQTEPNVTSIAVSQVSGSDFTSVSSRSDANDTIRSNDNTVSGMLTDPKLENARLAASALLTSKLQQQKDGNTDKPVKRTLASYGAKKSLPAAALDARPSNVTTTLHPASTPAGPGFRSSFLNKSLRKQIADQEALESDEDSESDSDADEAGLVAGTTFAAMYKKTAANTQANTRANAGEATGKHAALSSNAGVSGKKRKSDEALPVASEAGLGSAAPPSKMSKLGAAMLAAKSQSSAITPAVKKAPAVGPASKLEQFRNNLAQVARSTGSGASSSSASQSISSVASPALAETIAAPLPLPVKPAEPALVATTAPVSSDAASTSDDVVQEAHPRSSDSGSDSTEKIAPGSRSGESTIKASSIPRSPTSSPSRAAATSPVRLPPRTGSVRKSPRKLAEQQKTQEDARAASPGPKSKDGSSLFQSASSMQAPRSPTTQPRSLAALFGSPKHGTKLPTLSSAAAGSTTPLHSPPKNWQGSRLPFAQSFHLQQQPQHASREADKLLPETPVEEKLEPASKDRFVSTSSTILSTSKAELNSQFFDARSRENTPEPIETAPAALAAIVPSKDVARLDNVASKETVAPASVPDAVTKSSGLAKAAALSPKKAAAKALAKSGPTSPTKASALRAAANAASPSKLKAQSTSRTTQQSGVPASSTSPSRTWGIGEKIKGFLGLHASSTAAAQTKISASSTFQPRANGVPTSTASAAQTEAKAAARPANAAPAIPGALLASPPPASKAPQANSTPSSSAASSTTNGKLSSLARAEMLRKKQIEEEERRTKEKEERRRMLTAKKEERAKAVAEEELEKENRKRAREQTERGADASVASSFGAPAAIPAALLGNIVVGGGGSSASSTAHSTGSSRTSAVSTVSSGPPTRPSSALNGSYAGVKSRYMQTSAQQHQAQADESNKKRRVTNDREGGAAALQTQSKPQQQQPAAAAAGARPGTLAATSQIGAPKMVRTVSQSSIRAGPTSQAAPQQQQQHAQPSQANTQQTPQQIKPTMKAGAAAAAAAGFGAAPRIPGAGAMAGNGAATASMLAAANKATLASSAAPQAGAKSMANANFSSSNPFQQAKQQQLQMQMQKQKQLQMQQQQQQQHQAAAAASNAAQPQNAANTAAMREQELHRAAQLQFQMQNAAGGRFEEWGDHAQQGGGAADEVLPDIASEYSDSEDEETIQKRAAMPTWTQGDALDSALLAQLTVDADEIFGIPQGPVELEKILPGERTANRIRRPRTSSANWSGPDGLAQWEIDRYNKRMGIKGPGVQLTRRDGSHPPPPPPGVMARLSMAQRQSISHHGMGVASSSAISASSAGTNNGVKKDDPRGKM